MVIPSFEDKSKLSSKIKYKLWLKPLIFPKVNKLPLDKTASTDSSLPNPCNFTFSLLWSITESLGYKLNNKVEPTPESSMKFNCLPLTSIGNTIKLFNSLNEMDCLSEAFSSRNLLCEIASDATNKRTIEKTTVLK